MDSASNPLDGSKFWLGADDPWQFLASSLEIKAAYDSGDPASFESSLFVSMDGSCNGLQHYAALGRDYEGGSAVNLTPSDRPQDVYTGVIAKVIEKVRRGGGRWAV